MRLVVRATKRLKRKAGLSVNSSNKTAFQKKTTSQLIPEYPLCALPNLP